MLPNVKGLELVWGHLEVKLLRLNFCQSHSGRQFLRWLLGHLNKFQETDLDCITVIILSNNNKLDFGGRADAHRVISVILRFISRVVVISI